jgi:integrase/recombinase XerD
MSSLAQIGGTWYLCWSEGGRRKRRTTGLTVAEDPKRKLAEQVQRDFDSARARSHAGVAESKVTIADACTALLATKRQMSASHQYDCAKLAERMPGWMAALGVQYLDDVTPEIVQEWIVRRLAEVAPKTAKNNLEQLVCAARLVNRSRKISPIRHDLWPKIHNVTPKNPAKRGAYSADEVGAILRDFARRKCARGNLLPLTFLAYVGCRLGELRAARVGDLRLDASPPTVRLESRKTARNREQQFRWVEIHPELLAPLRAHVEGRPPSELIFPRLITRQALDRGLESCCERLGIQYKTVHGFRHSWITRLLQAGVPLATVMQMAGHRNIATTQGYLQLTAQNTGWISRL